ncbi:MAG: hypothetical protein IGS03_00700 [Candidatus Sericytochromatia bacterium]|nr:hypothetical protein [Candidatus Sericytochromatia bacterium]
MPDFPLDADNNIRLTDGDLAINDRRTDIQQRLRQRLRLFYGEWFRDNTQGVRWREHILIRDFRASWADREIRQAVRQVAGVTSITSIDVQHNHAEQQVSVTVRYKDDAGSTEEQEVNITL